MLSYFMKLIITEKPSVARDIAKVLNIPNKQDGFIGGNGYVAGWAILLSLPA